MSEDFMVGPPAWLKPQQKGDMQGQDFMGAMMQMMPGLLQQMGQNNERMDMTHLQRLGADRRANSGLAGYANLNPHLYDENGRPVVNRDTTGIPGDYGQMVAFEDSPNHIDWRIATGDAPTKGVQTVVGNIPQSNAAVNVGLDTYNSLMMGQGQGTNDPTVNPNIIQPKVTPPTPPPTPEPDDASTKFVPEPLPSTDPIGDFGSKVLDEMEESAAALMQLLAGGKPYIPNMRNKHGDVAKIPGTDTVLGGVNTIPKETLKQMQEKDIPTGSFTKPTKHGVLYKLLTGK